MIHTHNCNCGTCKTPPPPPPHDPTLRTTTGWLSPTGKLYPCEYFEHDYTARSLGFRQTLRGDNGGFVKLQIGEWLQPYGDLTQAQIDTIFDWCQVHGQKIPLWMMDQNLYQKA